MWFTETGGNRIGRVNLTKITPTSNFFPYLGSSTGNGTVAVSAPGAWTAESTVSWLSIVSGVSGSGNGSVTFSVAANSTGAQRAGTLTIAGQTFTVTQAGPPPPTMIVPVVEYHNTVIDDYFITAAAGEQALVDTISGWVRTGVNFNSGGSAPVYRFVGPSGTHFYTLWTSEQSWLQTLYSPTMPSWVLEAPAPAGGFGIAMYMTQPNSDQSCPTGTVPVYRANNFGNHRFTPSALALQEVLNRGWINEGVAFCAPQ
jgi:hypothetical protein